MCENEQKPELEPKTVKKEISRATLMKTTR